MFSQVDRSIERTTGGLGIGLALVKGLVEMQGGSVRAESRGQGAGSAFTVILPLLAAEEASDAPIEEGPHPASVYDRRILVVDDNKDGAESLAMMLRLMGNDVLTAHDGLEAIAVAERFLPQIVLMDVGMPRLNGLAATKQIRGFAWGKEMTIIALTGWGQDHDREQSKAAGCNGHLVKPVAFSDIEDLLRELNTQDAANGTFAARSCP
jgi:CheY-like chemotaxis protein